LKKTIYTIGYGGRRLEDFVSLLKQFGIKQVVDVRAFPTSKYEGFKREELEKFLPQHGISYLWMEELGGYRRGGYEAYTRQRKFGEGVERLEGVAGEKPTVIMCLEGYPSGCHRRFISRELAKRGWRVLHIVGKGRILEESSDGGE
jgi:uncharacterized protein (DUF488 family)